MAHHPDPGERKRVHIVLDLQACQSPESSRRGIGRYSLALAKAIARGARDHKVTVLLSASMSESIEFLRGQFDTLLPQAQVVTWESLNPTAYIHPANTFRGRAAALLRLHAIRQLQPDIVHVSSLFEGLADDVICTIPADSPGATAVTLYDLIPLAHQETYLRDPRVRQWYMEKIGHLRRAGLFLGISQFSCDEAFELLDIPRDRLVNISGAADDIFTKLENAEAFRMELMHRYGLQRPFIMYTGGFDSRKNIGALIRAFALLPLQLRRAHQLVIVGGAPAPERAALMALIDRLGLRGDEVVFAGFVPDADLVKLYNLCALYTFPSLQEGFGLPALEAMASGAIVIGSNTSSLPEVIGFREALFDPRSDVAIADKMVSALTDQDLRESMRASAQLQCQKFSWDRSATVALDAFEALVARGGGAQLFTRRPLRAHTVKTALIAAPHSSGVSSVEDSLVVYADADCAGVTSQHSLADFVRDRDAGKLGRVVLELSDDPYCARTLPLADQGAVDVHMREPRLGAVLEALLPTPSGRSMIIALLYRGGGYPAVREALDANFSRDVLTRLVTPQALVALGRAQVLSGSNEDGQVQQGELAWRRDLRPTISALVAVEGVEEASGGDWSNTASALAYNSTIGAGTGNRQWLVDISNLAIRDAGTGIQRVVRHVLDELIASPPDGVRVEPVCLGDDGTVRYARSYCSHRYFDGEVLPSDEPVEFAAGDVYLGLDLVAHLIPAHIELFRKLRDRGVQQYYVLYDLLPILRPDCFEPHLLPLFRGWYEAVAEVADGVACISRAVADEFESWLHQSRPLRHRSLNVGWFHLGADLAPAAERNAELDGGCAVLAELGDRPTFLMVGTIEPRKGHAQVLDGFEQLWQEGVEVNLLVVGKAGWLVDALLERLADHPMRGRYLFWFEQAGDDLLLAAYRRASALIMASEGEGFGLPLIEAAHHGVPLIARDLPVFREISAEHAHYFSGYEGADLACALRKWFALQERGVAPQPHGMHWRTWKESTGQLVDVIRKQQWTHRWMPTSIHRFDAFDYRLRPQVGQLVRGRMVASGQAGLLVHGPGVPFSAGSYAVTVFGGGTGSALLDVYSEAGTRFHLRCELHANGIEGGLLSQATLVLDADVKDLETRIWVSADSGICLDRIEVRELEPLEWPTQDIAVPRDARENAESTQII